MIDKSFYYLIDTDAATKIETPLLDIPFIHNNCKITEENLYELRGDDDIGLLTNIIWRTSPYILSFLPSVWAVITKKDKIFSLYQNEGNGDIMMLATLLSEREQNKKELFDNKWIIVSDDKGLAEVAERLSFTTIGSDEFITFLKTTVAQG